MLHSNHDWSLKTFCDSHVLSYNNHNNLLQKMERLLAEDPQHLLQAYKCHFYNPLFSVYSMLCVSQTELLRCPLRQNIPWYK